MINLYFHVECLDALGRGWLLRLDLQSHFLQGRLLFLLFLLHFPLFLLILCLLSLFFSFSFYSSSSSSSCSSIPMCGAEHQAGVSSSVLVRHFIPEPCQQPSHSKWIRLNPRKIRRRFSTWKAVRCLLISGKTKREAAHTEGGLRGPGLHSSEESEERGCTQNTDSDLIRNSMGVKS